MVEEFRFQADFVGREFLGLELQVAEVRDRSREQRRGVATALYAAVVADVQQLTGREMKVDLRLAGPKIIASATVVILGKYQTRRSRQLQGLARQALGVVLIGVPAERIVLFVVGEACTERESNEIRQPILELAKDCIGLGGQAVGRLGRRQAAIRVGQ